jgi:hypothetical protein
LFGGVCSIYGKFRKGGVIVSFCGTVELIRKCSLDNQRSHSGVFNIFLTKK